MKNVLGLINLYENEEELNKLTRHRPLAAIPFGGRYRIIDFILSNMTNSGIVNVGVIVPDKYRPLMDHLRSGREWDLARKQDGLFILPPAQAQGVLKSDIQHLYNHLDYIKRSPQQYVIIAGSQIICNIDLTAVFNSHIDTNADITVVYREAPKKMIYTGANMEFKNSRLINMEINLMRPQKGAQGLDIYVMSKALFIDIIEHAVAQGNFNFVKDGIIKNLDRYQVRGYLYKGYTARIDSINSYYKYNMDLLSSTYWHELFKQRPIFTKVKDEIPTAYSEGANINNSLVACGCIIEGTVENSIIFRGVRIHKGAVVKNSIIMQKSEIHEEAELNYVICDKDTKIGPSKSIKGEENYIVLIEKGRVI